MRLRQPDPEPPTSGRPPREDVRRLAEVLIAEGGAYDDDLSRHKRTVVLRPEYGELDELLEIPGVEPWRFPPVVLMRMRFNTANIQSLDVDAFTDDLLAEYDERLARSMDRAPQN